MKKVVVLGAGISGLSVGWFLKQKWRNQIDLTILEKSGRAGGWIRTLREKDFLFEAGPRGFSPHGKGEITLELVKSLGLQDSLIASSQEAKKRYIYLDGALEPFGLKFLIKQGLLSALLRDLVAAKTTKKDESIADFVSRRFNSRLATHLIDPLTKGIYGGDIHALSMRSCFPSIWRMEQEYGCVIRGIFSERKKKKGDVFSYTFQGGMETLTSALAHALKDEVQLNQKTPSLHDIKADAIISTLPMHALAPMLGLEDPCTYATLSLVHCGWHGRVLPKKGYGFLVPSIEKGNILGMTWDSEVFPKGDQTRICVMISGQDSEARLISRAQESLNQYLKISSRPDVQHVTIAERAIPQYTLGHDQRIEAINNRLPKNMRAIGTSFSGAGVNDSICVARRSAQELFA